MNKRPTRILLHLNQAGFGGTEKAILTFCENIDRSSFEVRLFINQPFKPLYHARLKLLSYISQRHKDAYTTKFINSRARLNRFQEVLGKENVHIGPPSTFIRLCRQFAPDIVHFNRGKWDKFFSSMEKKIPAGQCYVETNIFGYPAPEHYHQNISAYFFVSRWLLEKSPWHEGKGKVLYNPIKRPATTESLRKQYSIPDDAFVFGRISRPDLNDDDFILRAFERSADSKSYLLILAPTKSIREAEHPDNVILLDPTTSEFELSRFYNSLDTLLHYRQEGETFGMNIAEAMMHGVPVISHESSVDNAQLELLDGTEHGEVGLISPANDIEHYCQHMSTLLGDRNRARLLGDNARVRAASLYDEKRVTHTLEEYYRELIQEQGDTP